MVAGVFALVLASEAEQSGSGHYIPGATASFLDMTTDIPGLAAMNIFLDYNNANADAAHGLPFGGKLGLNVNANVTADSVFMMYTFEPLILGGHYAIAAAPGYVASTVKADGTIDSHGVTINKSISQTAQGFGDIDSGRSCWAGRTGISNTTLVWPSMPERYYVQATSPTWAWATGRLSPKSTSAG